MREIKLPSGALLKVTPASFAVSKALYQALLGELKSIEIGAGTDIANILTRLFCIGFTSPTVEAALWACFARCTYNGGAGDMKIDADTFEPVPRRDDYMKVCVEVARENVLPFGKSLYAEYLSAQAMAGSTPA